MRTMRWVCKDENGNEPPHCFRSICPRLGVFDDCFPRNIGMSDVDGVVEIGGRLLFLEWKSAGGVLTKGQRWMFENLTSLADDTRRVVVIVAAGNPETMQVGTVQTFTGGNASAVEPIDLDGLKARISAWADRAERHRLLGRSAA